MVVLSSQFSVLSKFSMIQFSNLAQKVSFENLEFVNLLETVNWKLKNYKEGVV